MVSKPFFAVKTLTKTVLSQDQRSINLFTDSTLWFADFFFQLNSGNTVVVLDCIASATKNLQLILRFSKIYNGGRSTSVNGNSLSGQGIDSNHPLLLSPIDVSGISIILFQLLRIENYTLWNRSIKLALLGKNKLGLIDGTCRKNICGEEFRDNGKGLMRLFCPG